MDDTFVLNDIHECSFLIHKDHIILCKITSWYYTNLVKI